MITLVNRFQVHGDPADFERVFRETAEFMRGRPGFIHSHLVRSNADGTQYFNIARWASQDEFAAAAADPRMRDHRGVITRYARPDPHACTTVAEFGSA